MRPVETPPTAEDVAYAVSLLRRIRLRHSPTVEERLLRERETWLDAGEALRALTTTHSREEETR